jgi:predicted Zn-dependent protease
VTLVQISDILQNFFKEVTFMAKRNRSTRNDFSQNRYFNTTEFEATVRRMTSYLRSLSNRRSSGVVTADDAHAYLTREGVHQKQVRTRLSFINAALAGSGEFEQNGMTRSTRPSAKGRTITAWTAA